MIFILFTLPLDASNLQVGQPILYTEPDGAHVVVNVSWDHAWHHQRNHDAVWLFFKVLTPDGQYHHLQLNNSSHAQINDFSEPKVQLTTESATDGKGLFVFAGHHYRGSVSATLKIGVNLENLKGVRLRNARLKAYGIEMVKIPAGAFYVGTQDSRSQEHGAYLGVTKIDSNNPLNVSQAEGLFYHNPQGYEGDQGGPIPKAYPKGVDAFYIMKYEITEGQYVEFLNSLDSVSAHSRSPLSVPRYHEQGGFIKFQLDQYHTAFPQKPCRFLSWTNAMAFADWAALRPMTELEYTKAARGPHAPNALDYPWGNQAKYKVQRLPDHEGRLSMSNGWTEAQLHDSTRVYFGASYYWVMDLSGSLWERLITLGHPNGRSFTGSHGDGVLSATATATNSDWPQGDEKAGGIGFRGGGFYGHDREYHEYNPFSPISYRPYGGWHGPNPSIAYGTRLVRTR